MTVNHWLRILTRPPKGLSKKNSARLASAPNTQTRLAVFRSSAEKNTPLPMRASRTVR